MNNKRDDIPLVDLIFNESLSVRAANICKYSGLITLSKLLEEYNSFGTFKNLRNCGSKTDEELIALCERYKDYFIKDIDGNNSNQYEIINEAINLNQFIPSNECNNISLGELRVLDKLSTRTFNICNANGLISLFHIQKFYASFGTFKELKNSGDLVESELVEICEKYQVSFQNGIEDKLNYLKCAELEKINSLSPLQKAMLDKYLISLISKLDVRTCNGLKFLSKELIPDEIYSNIFQIGFNFKNIRNIGKTSVVEFETFSQSLSTFIADLPNYENNEAKKEFAKLLLKTIFSNIPENFGEQFKKLFDEKRRLRLFTLIDLLIKYNILFSGSEQELFKFTYIKENNDNSTLSLIAENQNLTKERIRQIKSNLESNIQDYFLFVQELMINELVDYGVDGSSLYYIIDDIFIIDINERENVKFNKLFYSIIFGIFLMNSHFILGDDEVIHGKRKTKHQQTYTNCYLIKNNLKDIFNFSDFMEDIYAKKNSRIDKTYFLNLKSQLVYFFNSGLKENLYKVLTICESLIVNELSLGINPNGYIIFEKNTKKTLSEYCSEVLEENSHPMTLEQIKVAILKKYPDSEIISSALRSTLIREKGIFISFGRSSTYGMLKWELEKDNIKGGTIRDIVEDYLKGENTPKHISEILDHVLKYRPRTNVPNLKTNLILEKNNRFTFFNAGFIGLNSKSYKEDTTKIKRINGSLFRSTVLRKMKGWQFDEIVDHYVKNYDYNPIAVSYILKKKIDEGKLKFSLNNYRLL